jgi:hypothetical protein
MHFPFLHGLPGLSDFVSPCQDLELQESQPNIGFCALEKKILVLWPWDQGCMHGQLHAVRYGWQYLQTNNTCRKLSGLLQWCAGGGER